MSSTEDLVEQRARYALPDPLFGSLRGVFVRLEDAVISLRVVLDEDASEMEIDEAHMIGTYLMADMEYGFDLDDALIMWSFDEPCELPGYRSVFSREG